MTSAIGEPRVSTTPAPQENRVASARVHDGSDRRDATVIEQGWRRPGLRALGATIALALIVVGLFLNFTRHEKPKPPTRQPDTPHANASPVDEGLNFSAPGLDGKQST